MTMAERPHRILMTVDAVGGVWRYAMDLARGLRGFGVETMFAGLGPPPSQAQSAEANEIGTLLWLAAPLDWTVDCEDRLEPVSGLLAQLALAHSIDLFHLNLPSQAAALATALPVVVVSHSCVVTWFEAVRGSDVPPAWAWQERRNRLGFKRAQTVVAPSRSHAAALLRCYGCLDKLKVVYNSSHLEACSMPKQDFVLAAGRWWDEGKNAIVLDGAAALARWPILMAGPTGAPSGQYYAIDHATGLGELGHAQMMEFMAKAGIFSSPSLYEPFGLAVLEAALAGAALVLADIETYRELWDGVALFCEPRDCRAFANAINRFAGDKPMRAEFGAKAQARARIFSTDRQSRAMMKVYSSAVADAGDFATGGAIA
ncbi:glycosyl transferase [Rhizobium sp. R72]|uniref:glycosyltransferase family 4 protein n=1 Tax=unclassified Rhizobium TaxID=2613769 RepID=UPI000B52F452|nr:MULTISPECIES: glycosyltransferase family 4 protein [unclassified Rhizobium]OWV92805.1 glycosyl transferase [Rhizobium sp. R72]OWV93016.1 glycosyl transferase [Rhizobium sp. R711]